MPLRAGAIPSLINGVSQQGPSLRHPTQGDEQINFISSVASGLERRPPTQHVARLMDSPADAPFVHEFARDLTEQFVVVISGGTIRVFSLIDGSEATVSVPDGTGYLTTTSAARDAFSAVTFGDFTFIVNKEQVVAMSATTAPGSLAGTVQAFEDLPASPANGSIYKVIGDARDDFTSYYVKFDTDAYIEWIAPGIPFEFDLTTMPHVLLNNGDGTFTFEQGEWWDREAGDEDSAPDPSFVGKAIKDVFFVRGRLAVVAGESVITSRSSGDEGGFFSFWPRSVQSSLDTDPIDLDTPSGRASLLQFGVPFARTAVVFSRLGQFLLTATQTMTPETTDIVLATEFESLPNAKPVGLGKDLYFAVDNGSHVTIREYFVGRDDQDSANDATDVSAHVPRYIPEGVHRLAAASNLNTLLVLTSGEADALYTYTFFWEGDQRAQAAWSKWKLGAGADIRSVFTFGSRGFFTVDREDGLYLEHVDWNADPSTTDLGVTVHLDRRARVQGVYDAGTDKTTWTLPYATDGTPEVVLSEDWSEQMGVSPSISVASTTTLEAAGDWSANDAYIGLPYESRYRFSEQFVRSRPPANAAGAAGVAQSGRLQLRHLTVRFRRTGMFRIEVSGPGRDTSTQIFSAPVPAEASAAKLDDRKVLHSGDFSAAVLGRSSDVSIDVIADSWLPATFLSAQWVGMFTGKRTTS